MTNQELAARIIKLLGGAENIIHAENCMTRMRVNLKDPSKADPQAIKNTAGVLGVVYDEGSDYIQIVLGPGKVRSILSICTQELGVNAQAQTSGSDWKMNQEAVRRRRKNNAWITRVRVLADIFTPMIPAFIASGICSGLSKIVSILIASGLLPSTTAFLILANLFELISNAFLSYMAIYTGCSAAKQFGVNEMLGGMIGAASLNTVVNTISEALGWYNAEVVNHSVLSTGAGGIIGVVIGVWALSKIEKWVHQRMPNVLDVVFTPLATMLIAIFVYVMVIMPITGYFSSLITGFLNQFLDSSHPIVCMISGYILAATFLPLVLIGLHRGLIPIYAIQIETMGYTTLFPAVAMAGAGQVGAAFALYLKARKVGNTRLQGIIRGAIPAGMMGIGEPLIYGVTLPMMKPFITAGLGAGFGGAFCMLMQVASTASNPSGLLGVTIIVPEKMLYYLCGVLISYIAGAVITYLFISEEDAASA